MTCGHPVQSQREEELQDLLSRFQHQLASMPVTYNNLPGIQGLAGHVRRLVMQHQQVTTEMAALIGAGAEIKVCGLTSGHVLAFPASARTTPAKIPLPWHA